MLKHLSLEELVRWLLGPQGEPLLMNPPVSLFCRALNWTEPQPPYIHADAFNLYNFHSGQTPFIFPLASASSRKKP